MLFLRKINKNFPLKINTRKMTLKVTYKDCSKQCNGIAKTMTKARAAKLKRGAFRQESTPNHGKPTAAE